MASSFRVLLEFGDLFSGWFGDDAPRSAETAARRNRSVHAWRAMEGKRCHCIKRIIVVSKQLGPDPSIRGWELGLDNLMFQKPKLLRSPSRPVAIIA